MRANFLQRRGDLLVEQASIERSQLLQAKARAAAVIPAGCFRTLLHQSHPCQCSAHEHQGLRSPELPHC